MNKHFYVGKSFFLLLVIVLFFQPISTVMGDESPIPIYTQEDLAALNNNSISNYYVAKIKPGKHSLIVPLGAKATLNLDNEVLLGLPKGTYTLKITDISGAYWEHQIDK